MTAPYLATAAQLRAVAPAASPTVLAAITGPGSAELFAKYGVDTRRRALGFLSVVVEETGGLRALSENLNYSAERLVAVWPKRFPNVAVARPFADNPRTLANYVYGGRMGNVGPDDGYAYRGRGLIQITGRDNYAAVARKTGLPLLDQPNLAFDPAHLLECSLALFVEFPGILGHCDRAEYRAVWALVGSGRDTGPVINLAAHQDALTKLQNALPDAPAPAAPAQVEPPPPVAAPKPQGLLARFWHWLAG